MDAASQSHDESHAPVLVGREREQASLADARHALLSGRGRLVLIAGEAGIGKTALARACCADAARRGAVVLHGRCYELTETPPYGPWIEAVSRAPEATDDPGLRPLLLRATTDRMDAQSQVASFARVRDYFRVLAARSPVVALLDDIHWADSGSLDLLRALSRELRDDRVLFLATYRIDDLTANQVLSRLLPLIVRESEPIRLRLRPLTEATVGALIRSRYRPIDEDDATQVIDYLSARADGNPFFIEELLHGLTEDGRLTCGYAGWAVRDLARADMPLLLRQVIMRRIARLGDEAERVFAVAAVIGHEVPLALWASIAGVPEDALLDLAERAVSVGELEATNDGTSLRFTHALIREALYTGLFVARRRALHRTIGETLAADARPNPDAVAYHFRACGDPRVVGWLIRAGDRAAAAHAQQTAVDRCTEALAQIGDDGSRSGERCAVLIRLARLLRTTDVRQSVAYAEESSLLAEQAGDDLLLAMARFRLGMLLSYAGRRERGLAIQSSGLRALDNFPEDALRRVATLDFVAAHAAARHGSLALRLTDVGRYNDAARHAERALADANGQVNLLTHDAYLAQAAVERNMGNPEASWVHLIRVYELNRTLEDHDLATWLLGNAVIFGALSYWTDDRERLEGVRTLLDARVPRPGDVFATLSRQVLHIPVLYLDGAWAQIRQIAVAARRTRFARHPFTLAIPLVLSEIAVAQGDTALAWTLVREEFPAGVPTEPGDHRFVSGIALQRVAATLAIAANDLDGAREWLESHDRWLAWSGGALGAAEGALLWADYYRATGDDARAREAAHRACAHATLPRQPLALLRAHRALGEIDTGTGRWNTAEGQIADALALADACAIPYERALALLARAELHEKRGRAHDAQADILAARTLCEPLGARLALLRADAIAAWLNPQGVARKPAHPDGLTAREVGVLRLLATGRSNREIAAELSLSVRTAERHIMNIYTKIDANGRADATAYAFRHGLA